MLATESMKLEHKLRALEDEVDTVLGVHYSVLSGLNFADSDYVTILDKEGINTYYGKTIKIIIS